MENEQDVIGDRRCDRRLDRGAWSILCSCNGRPHQIGTVNAMNNVEAKKSTTCGDRTDRIEVEPSEDLRLELPNSLRGKSIHDIWGPGCFGPLIRRLEDEHKLGQAAPSPPTRAELATLVELYEDDPSQALRGVLLRELRNERREKSGPKVSLSPSQLERELLPIYYERAMRLAAWFRKRLIAVESRKKRWQKRERVPARSAVAKGFVRRWLPWVRDLDDKTISNKLSEMRDPDQKKKRAKSAKL